VGKHKGFDYGRTRNPTRVSLETTIASLEGASHGYAFSSGMAAADAVLRLLRPGDHLLIPDDAYGGTYRLVSSIYAGSGVTFSPVELQSPDALAAAWARRDPPGVAGDAEQSEAQYHRHRGRRGGCARSQGRCIVDNTFATPYLQQPLGWVADAVVHSSTKYLGGHSDVVGGFVATNDEELGTHLGFVQNSRRGGAEPLRLLPRGSAGSRPSRSVSTANAPTRT